MMASSGTVRAVPPYNTAAICSLLFAVLAWTVLPMAGMWLARISLMSLFVLPLIGVSMTLRCARSALRTIHESGGAWRGEGLARTAQKLAYAQLVLFALLLLFSPLITRPVLVHHVSVLVPQ